MSTDAGSRNTAAPQDEVPPPYNAGEHPTGKEVPAIEMDDEVPSDEELIESAQANLADAVDVLVKSEEAIADAGSDLSKYRVPFQVPPSERALVSIAASNVLIARTLRTLSLNLDGKFFAELVKLYMQQELGS